MLFPIYIGQRETGDGQRIGDDPRADGREHRVHRAEIAEQEIAVAAEARAVFGHGGSMLEPTTHARWAQGVLDRARVHAPRPAPRSRKQPPTRVA